MSFLSVIWKKRILNDYFYFFRLTDDVEALELKISSSFALELEENYLKIFQ